MDLNELQSVQSRERQTDSLQQLRATFYQDAADFIQDLEDERDAAAERADDPWNAPEVGRLNDDIDTAEGTVEAIYERRVGKIVKMASLAAADMPTDDEGLTEEEQALFDRLVTAIEQNREGVFAILDGEDPAIDPTDVGTPTENDSPVTRGSDPAETGSADPDPSTPPAESKRSAESSPSAKTTPSADDRREVSPDRDSPDGVEPGSRSDSSDGQPSESGIDAADLMGNGERSGADGGTIGDPESTDTGPAETEAAETQLDSPDSRSTQPAREGEPSAGVDAEQPVRDGGGVDARPTDSAGSVADGTNPDAAASPGTEPAVPAANPGSSGESADRGHGPVGSGGASGSEPAGDGDRADASVDRSMVRITDDVGPIYGVEGREYDLTTNDVVTLPEANVGPLLEQGAAERMD